MCLYWLQFMHMQRLTICALLLVLMVSCGKKSKDINADEAIETTDFIESFPLRELPITFQQKDLKKIESDSFFIKTTVVSKFLPDSIFKAAFPKTKDVRFYRKGRYKAAESGETYLFLSAEKKDKKNIYLICFDADNEFKASMILLEKSSNPAI